MNYAAHYDRLIARARGRALSGYSERHHIIPRCLEGKDTPDNLVDLTPEEHYVAHQLLVRVHNFHSGLVYAAMRMAKQCTGNRAYGWLRRRHAKYMREKPRRTGWHHSTETRAKFSAMNKGRAFPNRKRGIVFSDEHRANLSRARIGKKIPIEVVEKIAAANRGKTRSPETLVKLSIARRRRVTSPETRAKMSATRTGKKLGPPPEERRAKISATLRARWAAGRGTNQWTRTAP